MKVERKLDIFSRVTMNEVDIKRKQIKQDSNEKQRTAVDEAMRAAEKEAQERLREEQYKIDKIYNKQTVAASAEAKRSLITLRGRLTDELFCGVEADLRAFTETAEYKTYLTGEIKTTAGGSPGRYASVLVSPRDFAFVSQSKELASLRLTAERGEESYIGGFKLLSKDQKAMADHTFLSRLQREKEQFSVFYKNKTNVVSEG